MIEKHIFQRKKMKFFLSFFFLSIVECNRKCPVYRRPVCGSDGITYGSRCLLKLVDCKTGREISIRHRGKCRGKCFIYKQ